MDAEPPRALHLPGQPSRMATVRGREHILVGSSQWVQDENAQVSMFCAQEVEDFAFSARNEVEWLNEHMAEIFSKDQINVTDIFKTPGKLRGKTPRTARKGDPLKAREPLSEIFSANAQTIPLSVQPSNPSKAASPPKVAAFKVAEDGPFPVKAPQGNQANTDSGYHGLPEDDIDIGVPTAQSSAETRDTLDEFPHSPPRNPIPAESTSEDRSTTDRSFHSAKEEITKRDGMKNDDNRRDVGVAQGLTSLPAQGTSHSTAPGGAAHSAHLDISEKVVEEDLIDDESHSSSPTSSPARTLVRKSSLTFAALPAREPITTQKSIGARVSRTSHLDQIKGSAPQSGFLGRVTGGMSLGGVNQPDNIQVPEDDETNVCTDRLGRSLVTWEGPDIDSESTKLHNQSSTQRLHERINLLGKSQAPRSTKSIPAAVVAAQPQYPDLSKQEQRKLPPQRLAQPNVSETNNEIEEDWIKWPRSQQAQIRPQLPPSIAADSMDNVAGEKTNAQVGSNREQNQVPATRGSLISGSTSGAAEAPSASQTLKPETAAPQAAINTLGAVEAFYPDLGMPADASTTTIGSPSSQRYVDAHLSASKSKLQSIMKTAKGLFSSSAGISAQARMETMSPSSAFRHNETVTGPPTLGMQAVNATVTSLQGPKAIEAVTSASEVRKTRSSTEKEERMKVKEEAERRQVEAEKERLPKQESTIQKRAQSANPQGEAIPEQVMPARISPRRTGNQETVKSQPEPGESEPVSHPMGPPPNHASGKTSQVQRPKDVRRPVKPSKDTALKTKEPPLNIRVGMPSQRVPLTNAAISSNLEQSLPPAQVKQPSITKKASTASLQSSVSNGNLKSSSITSKPKALIAAERKKEQDEREAQRKVDQKREIERKRAAQQEEARRQEQLQRQEVERQLEKERAAAAEDPKKIAQRQAIEKRRLEMQKKDQRPPHVLPAIHQQSAGSTTRPDLGGARPPSRQQNPPNHNRPAVNHNTTNPSKGAIKRVFDTEADEGPSRPARPQGGPSYQQSNAKRRKTEDEELEEFPIRPTMAPPIRQSGIRKEGPKASIFSNNYNTAPPPASHHSHAPSLLKSTTSNQVYQQHAHQNQQQRQGYHLDISKYRDGNKIPFADNPNPPHHQHPQLYKTPLPSKPAQPSKTSPQYVNGENIQLAEIHTDSEDSDSSPDTARKRQRAASLPEWAQSPNLRELLEQQEALLDADSVFGPVPSPRMEDIFRERHHRFRSRTSSANWAGQDRLTEEEIRRDVEARARMRREGGWTFGL